MAKHSVVWNNGASLRLAEIMGHEYVDQTYKVLQDGLSFFARIKEEDQSRRIKVSEWKAWGNIYYAAHLAACDQKKAAPEITLDEAFSHVMSTPSDLVEVLTMAVEATAVKATEEEGKATA